MANANPQYTYYTVTAFNIKVPNTIKRSLTTLQISQFVIGAVYASLHSFVSYTVPVQVAVTKPAVHSPQAGEALTDFETQWQKVDCITTPSSTFAIWLNVF